MDTDELSSETYKGVIIEAEKFHHDLTLQFGLIADSCKNEKEYLDEAKELIKEIRGLSKSGLSEIFFERLPAINKLHLTLEKILANILEIEKSRKTKGTMSFKQKSAGYSFTKISVDKFIKEYKKANPQDDLNKLRKDLLHFRQLKAKGEKCSCGNSLWVIGSAISGKGCFTCITGETDFSDDYEIE